MAMVKSFSEDALLEAAARADQLQEDGDWPGALTWHRILDAIERLQARAPAEDERRTKPAAEASGGCQGTGTSCLSAAFIVVGSGPEPSLFA